jgi:hypothetical protein
MTRLLRTDEAPYLVDRNTAKPARWSGRNDEEFVRNLNALTDPD